MRDENGTEVFFWGLTKYGKVRWYGDTVARILVAVVVLSSTGKYYKYKSRVRDRICSSSREVKEIEGSGRANRNFKI